MIKFFRNIRQNLLNEGKTSKYLKYAIGEIVLVVIGILIALYINNWNQNRLDKKIEQGTLKALVSEFEDNRTSIKEYLDNIKNIRKHGDTLRKHLGPEITTLSKYDINRLIGETGGTTKILVSVEVLGDAQSSGRINLLSNIEVRKAISKWSSQLKELQGEEFDWAQEFSNQFVPYANKWIQWDDTDYVFNYSDSLRYFKSRFDIDPRLMLQQPEFANIMSTQYWRITRIELRTDILLKYTDTLIHLMKNDLN